MKKKSIEVHVVEDAIAVSGTHFSIQVKADQFCEVQWVPRSVIAESSEVCQQGDSGKLVIGKWWARQKGWIS